MAEERINVNVATAQELTQLPGIGPVLAERIATYRDTVGLFEEPAQIRMVSGIGEKTYRAIADRLGATTKGPHGPGVGAEPGEMVETSAEANELPEETTEEAPLAVGGPAEEATEEAPPEAPKAMAEEEAAPEIRALPSGALMLEEELTSAAEATEESAVEAAPETEYMPAETAEEAPPEIGEVVEETIEEATIAAPETPIPEEASPEGEAEPPEEPSDVEAVVLESAPPAARAEARREPAPSRRWWRRLSWLWTALLGGLLGMSFALLVFSGINGSLDVGHSRAVVQVRGRMDSLATDINSLQGSVEGLRKRLDALEELTVRMDRVEATVGDLQEATADLSERADVLDNSIATLEEELEAVSGQVATLQEQAEQTRSFFQALQTLLNDFFGEEAEGASMVSPTPTPEGK